MIKIWNYFNNKIIQKQAVNDIAYQIAFIQNQSSMFMNKINPITIVDYDKKGTALCSFYRNTHDISCHVSFKLFNSSTSKLNYKIQIKNQSFDFDMVDNESLNIENFILISKMIDFLSYFDFSLTPIPSLFTIEGSNKEDPISSIEWYSNNISLIIGFYLEQNLICYSIISKTFEEHGNLSLCNYKENVNKINSLLSEF